MPTRLEFLAGGSATMLAPLLAQTAIDWSFPGVVCAYARRLSGDAPFAQFHPERVAPAASVIKLLVLLAAAREIERRGWSWNHELRVRSSDVVSGSDTFGHDHGGEHAPLGALAKAMIEQSDNTAANVFVDWLGYEKIDAMGVRAGMQDTRMRRHFMDFVARSQGVDNTTTAADMGTLAFGLASGSTRGFAGVSAAACRKIVGYMLAQQDRDTIPAGITRDVTIANKTGELEHARHDVAIVDVGGAHEYVMVLLSTAITNHQLALQRLREIAGAIDAMSPP